jgi:hypothetical protein
MKTDVVELLLDHGCPIDAVDRMVRERVDSLGGGHLSQMANCNVTEWLHDASLGCSTGRCPHNGCAHRAWCEHRSHDEGVTTSKSLISISNPNRVSNPLKIDWKNATVRERTQGQPDCGRVLAQPWRGSGCRRRGSDAPAFEEETNV